MIGMLRRSRLRSALIWVWVSVPVGWVLMVEFMIDSTSVEGVLEHLILTLIPWAGIVVLSYNVVRRFREIHLGIDKSRLQRVPRSLRIAPRNSILRARP
jgi:hypothetical protein